ncbi:MAG: hypothetical protein JJU00_01400 [Opitutales bacterium]|nr:hypothetical protein [Opitutales bacterium]
MMPVAPGHIPPEQPPSRADSDDFHFDGALAGQGSDGFSLVPREDGLVVQTTGERDFGSADLTPDPAESERERFALAKVMFKMQRTQTLVVRPCFRRPFPTCRTTVIASTTLP